MHSSFRKSTAGLEPAGQRLARGTSARDHLSCWNTRRGQLMTRAQTKGGHFHAVRFYEDDTSLCRIVSGFIAEGVAIGQPALVIASAAHNECILDNLRGAGIDVASLQQTNDLLMLNDREMLNVFMEDGLPNPDRFH